MKWFQNKIQAFKQWWKKVNTVSDDCPICHGKGEYVTDGSPAGRLKTCEYCKGECTYDAFDKHKVWDFD